jgi:hypothetical protein
MKKLFLLAAVSAALAVPAALLAAAPTVTLQAAPAIVTYGGAVTLSGALSNQRAGQNINLEAQDCGQTAFKKLASVTTATNGAFTTSAKPTMNTSYRSHFKSSTSPVVPVKVRPQLVLTRVSAGKFTAKVGAGQSLVGKYVAFQRYKSSVRKYVTVKKVTLTKVTPGVAPTQVSSANFRSTVKRGTKVRLSMPQSQVGTCYVPANSRSVKA